MTDEQIRIAIAEFEGWKIHPQDRFIVIPPNSPHSVQPLSTIPPYLTSRDAICGAVAKLDDMRFCYFVEHLERVCGTDGWEIMGSEDRRKVLLATPSQMADALLLTLGHEI